MSHRFTRYNRFAKGLIGLAIVGITAFAIVNLIVKSRIQVEPAIQDFDGVDMVPVPAGCFRMGNDPGAKDGGTFGVTDGGEQCFAQPFWIDRTEVTNGQFLALDGVAARPNYWTDDDQPREQITWFEARDFCAKRGAQLPTEAEWEYAARGGDDLFYPWGNRIVTDNVVYSGNSSQTARVGSRRNGASWVGAMDMSGNVWEWVSTMYGVDTNGDYSFSDAGEKLYPYPYVEDDGREENSDNRTDIPVMRGGSWLGDRTANLRAAYRDRVTPDFRNFNVGFRCARDYSAVDF